MAHSSTSTKPCVFCDISDRIKASKRIHDDDNKSDANKTENETLENPPEYFFEDDQLFVIQDIKPQAPHHYLVITHEHIESAKKLTKKHDHLVKRMVEVGAQILKMRCSKDEDVKLDEIRFGFHWPPMTLVKHLHMHVFYPWSSMSFLSRNVVFRPGLVFVTPDWLTERIQGIPDE